MLARYGLMLTLSLCLVASAALSQDAERPPNLPQGYESGRTVSTSAYGQPLLPEGNPLQGLFTPQPQYMTPQARRNEVPIPAGNNNLIGGVFSSYGPKEGPAGGTNNMLQGAFTGQPRFSTPQSQPNPEPQAKFALPGYGQASFADLEKAGIPFVVPATGQSYTPQPAPQKAAPASAPAGNKSESKDKKAADDAKAAKEKEKEKEKAASQEDEEAETSAEDDNANNKDEQAEAAPRQPYSMLKDALFFVNNGDFTRALDLTTALIRKEPGNAEAHYLSAVCYVNLRDFKRAADEYRLVLQMVPTTALAQMAIDGLKKIHMPITMPSILPGRLPPLKRRQDPSLR